MSALLRADLLVIGSGAAGLTAALVAAAQGARVALATSGALRLSSSAWAQGGIAAAVAPDDSPELHGRDTLSVGGGLCSPRAVAVLVSQGPERVRWLERAGLAFDWEDGQVALGLEAGHTRRRVLHAGGAETGLRLVQALEEQVRRQPRITLLEHARAERLLGDRRGVGGALLRRRGHPLRVAAPAVLLATGGAAGLYARTTNPPSSVGAGVALAYRAGAAIADAEFVQFHPTALSLPGQPALLVSEAVRGEGGILLDADGRRFLADVHPDAELAPRDVVARAIHAQLRRGPVVLSLAHLDPAFVRRRFPNLDQRCAALGLDLARDPLPVAPAAHYFMGGVCTDLDGRTAVPGLYAAGEVACTGVHGANRLASNSLLECLVFATRAAEAALSTANPPAGLTAASGEADAVTQPPPDETLARELGLLLDRAVGVVRDAAGLREALAALEQWEASATAAEDADRLLVARLIATAALAREESRGAHFRADFPAPHPAFAARLVQRLGRAPAFEPLDSAQRGAA